MKVLFFSWNIIYITYLFFWHYQSNFILT